MRAPLIWEKALHTDTPVVGRVRTVHTERSDYSKEGDHWVECLRRPEESFAFDRQGRLVEQSSYNTDGSSVRMKKEYHYDVGGRLVEDTSVDADGVLIYRTVYSYDDSFGTCTLKCYDGDGNLNEGLRYTYDSEGEPLERINYYPNDAIKTRWVRETNREGVVKKCVEYGPDGSITASRVEADDPKNREYQKCYYDADGSLTSRWVSIYNSSRSEIERKVYGEKDSLERRLLWERDPPGNLVRTAEYSADGELREERFFVYAYDEVGNWTKRTFLIRVLGSEPLAYRPGPFIYRTITYWE